MATLVENILAVWESATVEQREIGMGWYQDAQGICEDFAKVHGVTPEVAAGVFAALSPQNGYGANIALARRFLASGGTMTTGYLSVGLDKAREIYAGGDIETILKGRVGFKTLNFFASIVSGGQDGVCIDRHAACLAWGERRKTVALTERQYQEMVDAYTLAAWTVGITPAEMQAVTWVVWRNRYWSKGAFDPKA